MSYVTVITRLYEKEAAAKGVQGRLFRQGFPKDVVSVVTAGAGDSDARLKEKVIREWVPEDAADAYLARLSEGASLVVVRASYRPLNAVRLANETFETSGALPANLQAQSFRIKPPKDHAPSVMKDHPRFLTLPPQPGQSPERLSDMFGWPFLSPPRLRDSAISGGRLFFGDGVKRGERALSVLPPGSYMSRFFWPAPLLRERKGGKSVISGGGHPFSRLLGWRTTR